MGLVPGDQGSQSLDVTSEQSSFSHPWWRCCVLGAWSWLRSRLAPDEFFPTPKSMHTQPTSPSQKFELKAKGENARGREMAAQENDLGTGI